MIGYLGYDESEDTFKRFQEFSEDARSTALAKLHGSDYNDIFASLQQRHSAANDNPDNVGDEVCEILLSDTFMSMLTCWEVCGRDLLKAKLSWTPDNCQTWGYTFRG